MDDKILINPEIIRGYPTHIDKKLYAEVCARVAITAKSLNPNIKINEVTISYSGFIEGYINTINNLHPIEYLMYDGKRYGVPKRIYLEKIDKHYFDCEFTKGKNYDMVKMKHIDDSTEVGIRLFLPNYAMYLCTYRCRHCGFEKKDTVIYDENWNILF